MPLKVTFGPLSGYHETAQPSGAIYYPEGILLDFRWGRAAYLSALSFELTRHLFLPFLHSYERRRSAARYPSRSTSVSPRRTPAKQWLPYNCFYSSLNAKYSILFLLLRVSSAERTGQIREPSDRGPKRRQSPLVRLVVILRLLFYRRRFTTNLAIG